MESLDIGQRIEEARRHRGWTQAQLAQAVSLERTALAKIESGQRRVSALELGEIARELGRRMEWFVLARPEAVAQHRNAPEWGSLTIDAALETATADVEMLIELGALNVPDRPPVMPAPVSISAAEELGTAARQVMAISEDKPLTKLNEVVFNAGLVPFAEPLDDDADAASLIQGGYGVAVINSARAVGRRRLALAHELGHFLVGDRFVMDFRIETSPEENEARLDRFARSFLVPADAVLHAWGTMLKELGLRRAAVQLASLFRVDMTTLARRLQGDLGAIAPEVGARIRSVRTNRADIVELDLHVPHDLAGIHLPRAFERAVLQAYKSEDISQERALSLLRSTFDVEDLPELPELSISNLWQVAT